jgi:D-alanyl-D-alanine carboxypeptidase/D-alanyl-D-alanine-endopeptidase (penicillin-binding protein 4)
MMIVRPPRHLKGFAHRLGFLLILLLLSQGAWAQNGGRRDLQASLEAMVKNFEANHGGRVGVSTMVFKTGKVPYSYNGTRPMVPASNLKLVTTAVATDRLGPDFRFETRLYGPATHSGGVATGDLVLKGGGDPSFYAPYVGSSLEPLQEFARALKNAGIKKVTGNLIVDDSDFDRKFISDTHLERYRLEAYAAPVSGLSLNRNVVTLNVTLGGVTTDPPTGSLTFVNKVSEGGYDQVWVERPRGTDKVILNGVLRPGSSFSTTLTIHDPVRFTGSAFFRTLAKAGIQMAGKWLTVPEGKPASLAGKVMLARHRSPKLQELIRETNVESDNVLAEHIFRRLGASIVGFGSARNSEAVVRDFFAKHGIDDRGLKMFDGCGLSESDRISPFQLVRVLHAMWGHHNGQIFIDSLPAPGEGTLQSRLGGALVRAKTGTLNNHTGLTGYVVTAYGQTVGFSILVNDVKETWPAVELQDRVVSLLSGWSQPL